jgi:hypothetical protein
VPNRIVVRIPPYEGEYPLDMDAKAFSPLEWKWLRRIADVGPLTIGESDAPSLSVALSVIAMYRDGRIDKREAMEAADVLEDPPFDGVGISVITEDEEEEADPQNGSVSADSPLSSGADLSVSTEPSPEIESQRPSGIPASVTGSALHQRTLET